MDKELQEIKEQVLTAPLTKQESKKQFIFLEEKLHPINKS